MADGSFGAREIYLDLTLAPAARVIRDATKGEWVKITGVRLNGTANAAGAGHIVLRAESATGPIVLQVIAATASSHDGTFTLGGPKPPVVKGLYMDSVVNAWQANSHMIVYTA